MALSQRESLAVKLSELRVVERAFDDLFDRVGARKLRHEEALQVVADEILADNQAFCRSRASCGWGTLPSFVDPRAIVEHRAPGPPPPPTEGKGAEQVALFSYAPSPWSRSNDHSEPEPGMLLSTVVFVARSVRLPAAVRNRRYRPRAPNVEPIVHLGLPSADQSHAVAKSKRRTARRRRRGGGGGGGGGRGKARSSSSSSSRELPNSPHEAAASSVEADENVKHGRTIRMRAFEAPTRDQSMDFIVKIVTAKHKRLMTPWMNNLTQWTSSREGVPTTSNDKTDSCSSAGGRSFLNRNVCRSRDRIRKKEALAPPPPPPPLPESLSRQGAPQNHVQPSALTRGDLAVGNKPTVAEALDGRANLLASASLRHQELTKEAARAATSLPGCSPDHNITETSNNGSGGVGRRRSRTRSSHSRRRHLDQPRKDRQLPPQGDSNRVENAFRRLLSIGGSRSHVREAHGTESVSLLGAFSSVDVPPASSHASRSGFESNSLLSSVVVEDDEDESSNGQEATVETVSAAAEEKHPPRHHHPVVVVDDGNLSEKEERRGSPGNGFRSLLDAVGGVDTEYTSSLLSPTSSAQHHHHQAATRASDSGAKRKGRGHCRRADASIMMAKKKRNVSQEASRLLHIREHCPQCGFQLSRNNEEGIELAQRKRQRRTLDQHHESRSTLTRMYGAWQRASPAYRSDASTHQSSRNETGSGIGGEEDGSTTTAGAAGSALFSSLLEKLFPPRLCLPPPSTTTTAAAEETTLLPCDASHLWNVFQPGRGEQATRTHGKQTAAAGPIPPPPRSSLSSARTTTTTSTRPNHMPTIQESMSRIHSATTERKSHHHPSRTIEAKETTGTAPLCDSQSWLAGFWADCGVEATLQQPQN